MSADWVQRISAISSIFGTVIISALVVTVWGVGLWLLFKVVKFLWALA